MASDIYEKAYKNALKEMKKGFIVYCSSCDTALSRNKKLFIAHMKKHE